MRSITPRSIKANVRDRLNNCSGSIHLFSSPILFICQMAFKSRSRWLPIKFSNDRYPNSWRHLRVLFKWMVRNNLTFDLPTWPVVFASVNTSRTVFLNNINNISHTVILPSLNKKMRVAISIAPFKLIIAPKFEISLYRSHGADFPSIAHRVTLRSTALEYQVASVFELVLSTARPSLFEFPRDPRHAAVGEWTGGRLLAQVLTNHRELVWCLHGLVRLMWIGYIRLAAILPRFHGFVPLVWSNDSNGIMTRSVSITKWWRVGDTSTKSLARHAS